MTDGMYLNPKPVKTTDGETVETAVEYSLVDGTYGVRLDPDAELMGSKPRPRLTAQVARQLAVDLLDQADEADKRNGVRVRNPVPLVLQFLAQQLDRDDMSLAEIAAEVTRIAREG